MKKISKNKNEWKKHLKSENVKQKKNEEHLEDNLIPNDENIMPKIQSKKSEKFSL